MGFYDLEYSSIFVLNIQMPQIPSKYSYPPPKMHGCHLPESHNHYTWLREKLKFSDVRNLTFVKRIFWTFNSGLL